MRPLRFNALVTNATGDESRIDGRITGSQTGLPEATPLYEEIARLLTSWDAVTTAVSS